MEALSFRDAYDDITDRGAVVLGVSTDPLDALRAFKAKHGLPFPLLSDPDQHVHGLYGTWVEKTYEDKTYWGTARTTFVIGPDGRLRHIFEKVRPQGHGEEVLAVLKALDE